MPEYRRRRADTTPWILRWWPVLAFVAAVLSSATVAVYDLKLEIHDLQRAQAASKSRENYHWGEEW